MSKKYTTNFLEDTNGSTGTTNQVLVSTATGVDWVDGSGSGIIGGPYLPLTAGASYPLTGDLYVSDDILPVTNIASNLGSSTNSFLYTHTYVVQSAGVLQLNAGGSERMRITSTGNVGIGTTAPTEKLSVVGKIDLNDGGSSVFIGTGAGLNDDASDNRNVGVGYQALYSNTTGADNTANGVYSLYANTTGVNNTANGFYSLYSNTTGNNNTANGYASLNSNTTGGGNTANGFYSLSSNTTGADNTANGFQSLFSNTTGGYNIATGRDAGRYISDGSTLNTITNNSVYLGYNTKALADNQTNQIVIGYEANGIGSNTVVLGNDSIVKTALKGNVGIGTASPAAKLDVTNGNGKFCVDSKTHALTNAFTTCLTINLNSHTGCYVTLTCFGDWGSHSSAAYRGEFFIQNGANGYAEPGIILRQDDNTSVGTDQIVCQLLDPVGTGNPKDFEIQIRTTATTGTTSFTGQLTYTVQGQFNSIT
jgi:hypothetical protein